MVLYFKRYYLTLHTPGATAYQERKEKKKIFTDLTGLHKERKRLSSPYHFVPKIYRLGM